VYRRMVDAGLHILALWPIVDGNKCGCGDPDCDAVGKHPLASNWQYSPLWSDEQLDVMEEMGQFATGYGVLVSGLLVVDIDERNGGAESYKQLFADCPDVAEAGMVVRSGSGGASRHFYFSLPGQVPLVQNLDKYPGIDFKSTGYVVGPGSHHVSGGTYDLLIGGPEDICEAPPMLVDALRKPDLFRSLVNGGAVDVSEPELADMLRHIPNTESTDYEQWIRVGMAVHLVTGGTGYNLWETWSKTGPKHNVSQMQKKWGSFGKSANPVTLGTLVHYAEAGGWRAPVTFQSNVEFPESQTEEGDIDTSGVDLLRPPGFVGELAKWIESKNRHPRESLAVAAAIATVSAVAGMRYTDPLDGITPNVFLFGVAGSATGKESVLRSHQELLRVAGVAQAVHGGIKSEQEIYKNLIRNQAAFYVLDELGEILGKLKNARTKGTAAYLEGVIGALMSLFSKASGYALITGDLKKEVQKSFAEEYVAIEKKLDKGAGSPELEKKLERIKEQLVSLELGLKHPYLNVFGLTTPERFGDMMDYEMATTGFIGRALIFREREDNPRAKKRDKINREEVPIGIANTLTMMYNPGRSSLPDRVECVGDQIEIPTRPDAVEMLDRIESEFYERAENEKNESGMTPIVRRGYELTAKISMILAIPEGVRTVEHVRWAYALIKKDIQQKILLTNSNSAPDKSEALASRIMGQISADHGETIGRLRNKCRAYRKEDVDLCVEKLKESGYITEKEEPFGRGRTTKKYFAKKS